MISELQERFQSFLENKCEDPNDLFGLFEDGAEKIIRFYLPGQEQGFLELQGKKIEAQKIEERGLFECAVPKEIGPLDYKIVYPFKTMHDPYVFNISIGEQDIYLFNEGTHYELYNLLGAHICEQNGILGTRFRLWAPHAVKVTLLCDFNNWDGRVFPLKKQYRCGIWEIFIPFNCEGQKYKFDIYTEKEYVRNKADPMAFSFEKRPKTASIVCDTKRFLWDDHLWMEKRIKNHLNIPINIYEVHLGSWKKEGGKEFSNYRHLAHEIAEYCTQMGFTHVELLPIMEHPLDESWGYQITGFYAPTSRYGSFEDFQYFVNYLHNQQIGVILDWVPGHFPMDDFALNYFDGSPLYENKDPVMARHPHWSTAIFDYSSKQVQNFLIANALFWLQELHVDGLRSDAIASMLYLDYGRENERWTPNKYGSNYNLEAIEFLKHLNSIVHKRCVNPLMIAEESSAFEKVTAPVEEGGLGFDLKWKMGWMNDSLSYFSTDPLYRKFKHNNLTFSMWYAYSEKFLLPLSHDEVVHEKKSLINKLDSSEWMRLANLRLLYSYMICHPGKKLLFMGAEIGQLCEWNSKDQLSWELLEKFEHLALQEMIRDLNHFYKSTDAFWKYDFDPKSFSWIEVEDADLSILSYVRVGTKERYVCIHNCTPVERLNYRVKIKDVKNVREVFNTDLSKYGGSDKKNSFIEKFGVTEFEVILAPMASMIFEVN